MKLTSLTNPSLINLQTTFESRDAAIRALADQLNQKGKLHNKEEYTYKQCLLAKSKVRRR